MEVSENFTGTVYLVFIRILQPLDFGDHLYLVALKLHKTYWGAFESRAV